MEYTMEHIITRNTDTAAYKQGAIQTWWNTYKMEYRHGGIHIRWNTDTVEYI